MKTEKLTSIKIQPVINIEKPGLRLLMPVLNFGRKKSGRFKIGIIFKSEKQASKLYDELKLLIGKRFHEVVEAAATLYDKYKVFDYRHVKRSSPLTKHITKL